MQLQAYIQLLKDGHDLESVKCGRPLLLSEEIGNCSKQVLYSTERLV